MLIDILLSNKPYKALVNALLTINKLHFINSLQGMLYQAAKNKSQHSTHYISLLFSDL